MNPVVDGIVERVSTRFAALLPEQRTVEEWYKLVFQEILREVADFLAKAVVEEFLKQPRWRWKERARLVRLLNRRIACLRR